MSLMPPVCTCDQREHACSPPCKAHPEKGGGLGNPGTPLEWKPPLLPGDEPVRTADEVRNAVRNIVNGSNAAGERKYDTR